MDSTEPSSLDRFLWRHGQELLDTRLFRQDKNGVLAAGWLQLFFGLATMAIGLALHNDAVIILLCAGFSLTVIGAVMLRAEFARPRITGNFHVQIANPTPEGQRLVHKICSHIGYYNYQEETHGRSLVNLRGLRTSSQVLRKDLFELLDAAAHQFNRIDGLLQERSATIDSGVRSLGPSSRVAALEAMAVIVNHAVWIDTFPENAEDHRFTIVARTERLEELADRLGSFVQSRPTLIDSLSSRSLIDEVLDKLAMEEEARGELAPGENDAEVKL